MNLCTSAARDVTQMRNLFFKRACLRKSYTEMRDFLTRTYFAFATHLQYANTPNKLHEIIYQIW